MTDPFNLQRFVDAQAPVYARVLDELGRGRKRSHWMWFIFPQLAGLGYSPMAQRYALISAHEAAAYWRHPMLHARLLECTRLVTLISDAAIGQIFPYPDDLKFHSSMTLFACVDGIEQAFGNALWKYYGGEPDLLTLRLLATEEWRPHPLPK